MQIYKEDDSMSSEDPAASSSVSPLPSPSPSPLPSPPANQSHSDSNDSVTEPERRPSPPVRRAHLARPLDEEFLEVRDWRTAGGIDY